ncbi:hypothetical protein Tco_1473483 [Tanacetum coccineum]
MLHNQPHHSHVTLNSGSDRVIQIQLGAASICLDDPVPSIDDLCNIFEHNNSGWRSCDPNISFKAFRANFLFTCEDWFSECVNQRNRSLSISSGELCFSFPFSDMKTDSYTNTLFWFTGKKLLLDVLLANKDNSVSILCPAYLHHVVDMNMVPLKAENERYQVMVDLPRGNNNPSKLIASFDQKGLSIQTEEEMIKLNYRLVHVYYFTLVQSRLHDRYSTKKDVNIIVGSLTI